jgi:hypothetical protein
MKSDGSWYSAVCSLLLLSLVLAGCSHHDGIPTSGVASPDQHLPFDASSDKGGIFPTGSLIATAIPAGTPLAVRLRTALSSATSRAGDSFEAILDEPIMVHGKMLAPRGSVVSGKVLDAKAASALQEPGYMRLALTSVTLQGQPVAIQTSSIFVKRNLRHERNPITLAGAHIKGAPIGGSTSIGGATLDATSIGATSLGATSVSGTIIGVGSAMGASIDTVSTRSLEGNGHGNGNLIGASTSRPAEVVLEDPIENQDVGVSAERRLTFHLAQPLPLGM